jgi:hypothetical protein
MEMQTETNDANLKAPRQSRGRKDATGQEIVKNLKPIKDALKELCALKEKSNAAKERFGDAIKKVAEDSGYLAAAVRGIIEARVSEKYEEKRVKVDQQSELFAECGQHFS